MDIKHKYNPKGFTVFRDTSRADRNIEVLCDDSVALKLPKKLKFTDEQIEHMLIRLNGVAHTAYWEGNEAKKNELRAVLGFDGDNDE